MIFKSCWHEGIAHMNTAYNLKLLTREQSMLGFMSKCGACICPVLHRFQLLLSFNVSVFKYLTISPTVLKPF